MSSTPLIISTGDICDVDGMLAIALYAQSGADLLFVMNFPAYLGVMNGTREKECEYGLGYVYDTETFLRGCNDNDESYRNILKSYTEDSHVNLSFVLRDLAFYMTSNTWSGVNSNGRFYFTIGDVNTINPYSSENCINEVHIYAKCVKDMKRLKAPTGENSVYNIHGEEETNVASLLEKYERIIMDFNGSAAFWFMLAFHAPDFRRKKTCQSSFRARRSFSVRGAAYSPKNRQCHKQIGVCHHEPIVFTVED